jgi:hypothetical protein
MHNLIKFLYLGSKVAQSCKEDGIGETIKGGICFFVFVVGAIILGFVGSFMVCMHRGCDEYTSTIVSVGVVLFLPIVLGIGLWGVSTMYDVFLRVFVPSRTSSEQIFLSDYVPVAIVFVVFIVTILTVLTWNRW